MDWHDIQEEGLNWGNGIALGLDVVGAAIPFVPSVVGHVRRAGKALSHADNVGMYGKVGGHRIHTKSAWIDSEGRLVDPNYNSGLALSISIEYMAARGWSHSRMTSRQHELFSQLQKNRGDWPNSWKNHDYVAVEALVAGGVPRGEARSLVAMSLLNLRAQGVTKPACIPWAP
ncbi:MAG TPA: hypothetical protein VGE04_07035 [Chloroflexia bacterium]|jgi:hypothetical protein